MKRSDVDALARDLVCRLVQAGAMHPASGRGSKDAQEKLDRALEALAAGLSSYAARGRVEERVQATATMLARDGGSLLAAEFEGVASHSEAALLLATRFPNEWALEVEVSVWVAGKGRSVTVRRERTLHTPRYTAEIGEEIPPMPCSVEIGGQGPTTNTQPSEEA